MKILVLIFSVLALSSCGVMEAKYQNDMDKVRSRDAYTIANLVASYSKKEGKVPFFDESRETAVMVFIARSEKDEQKYSSDPTLNKGAKIVPFKDFESELKRVLGPEIMIPRDPQRVATLSPNIYAYFVVEDQFCTAAYLYNPTRKTVHYSWSGGAYHSLALCFSKDESSQ